MGLQSWTWLSNWACMPLILSTCKTLTRELGPNMSLTFWKEREEKLKLRTETQDGARKCQLLLAHFLTMFWQLRLSSTCKWLAQSWVRPAELLSRPLVTRWAPMDTPYGMLRNQRGESGFQRGDWRGEGPSHWEQMCPCQVWTQSRLPWKAGVLKESLAPWPCSSFKEKVSETILGRQFCCAAGAGLSTVLTDQLRSALTWH